jgi:hypothetical protein
VAGVDTGWACSATDEEHVRYAGSATMAREDLDMDGASGISSGESSLNSEKTIFMKRIGDDWIMHGLYVDDMIHMSTSEEMKQQFIHEYTRDFEITLEATMTSFLGLEIEQGTNGIDWHLDTYIKETIADYQSYFKTFQKPKKVPMMQPGVVLDGSDYPEMPDPRLQKIYRSIMAKLQFASTWIRCDTAFATSQLARFCASAGRISPPCIACNISWDTWCRTPVSSCTIVEAVLLG